MAFQAEDKLMVAVEQRVTSQVRTEICAGLSWIGVNLDKARNRAASNPYSLISDGALRCEVRVLTLQEDKKTDRHAWALLA